MLLASDWLEFGTLPQRYRTIQGQKFVAVLKAKNRGAATSQNVKNRGFVAAQIVKIAAMSRKNRENRDFVAANILIIAAKNAN